MSMSRWAYHPDKCDGDYCPGDCDICDKSEREEVDVMDEEILEQIKEIRNELKNLSYIVARNIGELSDRLDQLEEEIKKND